jgi:hypothetical protein
MNLPIICSRESVSTNEFITFWARQVPMDEIAQDDKLYTPYIGKPLTRESLEALYLWKNQMRLSGNKSRSVAENFIAHLDTLRSLPTETEPKSFLKSFAKGGAIWRIFLLHCWSAGRYPIYDQNVHRAMTFIRGSECKEIPASDQKKIDAYLEQYVPFFHSLGSQDGPRQVDRALTALGRFLAQFPHLIPDHHRATLPART